jgi:hypothetical protein
MIGSNGMGVATGRSRTSLRIARAPLGALLSFVGAALSIAGSFLPWAHVTLVLSPIAGTSIPLDPDGWNGDGNIVFALGIVAAIIGALLAYQDRGPRGRVLRTAVLLCGLAIVGVTFWDTTHVSSRFGHVAQQVEQQKRLAHALPRVHARVDPGIVIAAGGGAILVFAAAVDRLLFDEAVIEVQDD